MRSSDMSERGVVLLVTALCVLAATGAQSKSSQNGRVKPDIKNAYSLGQVSASQVGIRSAYSNDQQNPTMLTDLDKLDQLIKQHTQALDIAPLLVLNILKGIDPKSPDANPLTSRAELIIEQNLKEHGLSDKGVTAYDLGWKTSAYSQTCALALSAQDRAPDLAAKFMSAYPEMVHQLKIDAINFGIQVRSPQLGLSLSDTCEELKATVTSLNNSLQIH